MTKLLKRELVEGFKGSELHSLLIEVFSERASVVTAPALVRSWLEDRFVTPGPVSPRELLRMDSLAYDIASEFEAIELSPVCPLGTNSSIALVSQKKVLSTIRNTEVVADSTNVMALECAIRRARILKINPKDPTVQRLCTSHRLLRTQLFGPGMTAHFRVFSMCTSGRDSGNYQFEAMALAEQVSVYFKLLNALNGNGFLIHDIKLRLFGTEAYLMAAVRESLNQMIPDLEVEDRGARTNDYYTTASFKLMTRNQENIELELGDGGFTEWTQKLLGNSKERLMISGLGTERLISKFSTL